MARIYTIPASRPFGRTLAKGLMDRAAAGEAFSDYVILLPTRRACRTMREAFLRLSGGRPLLLPRLQPLGDVDEEELALHVAGSARLENLLDIPPALSPLRRRILLARLVAGRGDIKGGFGQALRLAEDLGRFIDQIYIEELEFSRLENLVPEDFADHWQITLDFLKILGENWPKILETYGAIDAADRRGRVMRALAELWQDKPPQCPVIAAGSTGSIPATARLMEVIASLPRGEVVLPGYDAGLDEESWQALAPAHPQYGFKQLFARMNIDRERVALWPDLKERQQSAREFLAREVMRPAETAGHWMDLGTSAPARAQIEEACKDLSLVTCDTQREEAEVIAAAFRDTLETPGRTAALVTPDRDLARRVSAACRRWGLIVDDSAGQDLPRTSAGSFLLTLMEAALQNLSPAALLALLRHPLCMAGDRRDVAALDEYLLRGPKPRPGLAGLRGRLDKKADQIPESASRRIKDLLDRIDPVLSPFLKLCGTAETRNFAEILHVHLETAQTLSDPDRIWSGEAGEQASQFFAELLGEARQMTDLSPSAYLESLHTLMEGVTVRPSYGAHPRLMILGQLEARLVDADLMILGSLNEGTWPADTGHDPFMSRPMRRDFGLPDAERSVGLSAHDFEQALCANAGAGRVMLTRARRVDGAPTVPARWLQRLNTVLSAAGLQDGVLENDTYRSIVRKLDQAERIAPVARPAPKPPAEARPVKVSVTKIESWMQDPYQIYARYVLNLKKLDPAEKPLDAAQKGSVLHDILDRFVQAHPDDLPNDPQGVLMDIAAEVLAGSDMDEAEWNYWWPRFGRITSWLADHETRWRMEARPLKTEAKGEWDFSEHLDRGHFILHGVADRIDRMRGGGAAVIDYKSGGSFSKSGMKTGKTPQLLLEALMLQEGAFADVGTARPEAVSYWTLTGGADAGKIVTLEGEELDKALEVAHAGLTGLVTAYQDPDKPFLAQPRSGNLPRFNDYAHLARVKEWSAGGEEEGAES